MNKRIIIFTGVVLATILSCRKTETIQAPPPSPDSAAAHQTLLQRLKNNYDYSEFYNALVRVHLDTLLSGAGPYTVLVPDNVALQAYGITADSLARMDTAQLRKILAYHILPGTIPYAGVPQALDFVYNNIQGLPLYFSEPIPGAAQNQNAGANNPILHVDGVPVTATDVLASNGIIQVMGGMLPYPAGSIKSLLINTPQYSLFTAALRQFHLLDQLDSPGHQVVLAPTNTAFQNQGIDADSISRMNAGAYKNYLFGIDILQTFFFVSDIADGPQEGATSQGDYYTTSDNVLVFSHYSPSMSAYPISYLQQQQLYNSYRQPLGDNCSITDPDHLTTNGIVQGIGGLLIYPDSALVTP